MSGPQCAVLSRRSDIVLQETLRDREALLILLERAVEVAPRLLDPGHVVQADAQVAAALGSAQFLRERAPYPVVLRVPRQRAVEVAARLLYSAILSACNSGVGEVFLVNLLRKYILLSLYFVERWDQIQGAGQSRERFS